MKTASPRNCTMAQPCTPYSSKSRFRRIWSRYQLWSWIGSWSGGFSWPCSSPTWSYNQNPKKGRINKVALPCPQFQQFDLPTANCALKTHGKVQKGFASLKIVLLWCLLWWHERLPHFPAPPHTRHVVSSSRIAVCLGSVPVQVAMKVSENTCSSTF